MAAAFFLREGDRYLPTELTRGPWDPNAQHGGPPAALLGTAMEACERRDDMMVVRTTFEILRPVPIAPVMLQTAAPRWAQRAAGRRLSLGGRRGSRTRASGPHPHCGCRHSRSSPRCGLAGT